MNTLPFTGTVGPSSPDNFSDGMVLVTEHHVFDENHEFVKREHRTGVVIGRTASAITVEYAGGVTQDVLPMDVCRVAKP